MKLYIVIFVFTCFVFKSVKGFRDAKTIGIVNDLLDGLALETWNQEEFPCRHATEAILNGVKNHTLWASWVWDSMQLPVGTLYGSLYHLGNFDQCLNVPWPSHQGVKTQYCLLDVKLSPLLYDEEEVDTYADVGRYIGTKFRNGKRLNTIVMGVCLPAICMTETIAKISRHIFSLSHLPFKDIMVDPRDCQVAGTVEKPMGYYIFWFTILVMASVSILVYFFGDTHDKSDSTVSKIKRCFCLTRNFDALTEVYKDEIQILHGIKVLTCGTVTVAHLIWMFLYFSDQTDVEKELNNNSLFKLSLHVDLCVDTFFVISGLLHFRSLMSSRSYQPVKTLMKRYLRLLFPLYVLSIVCITYVLPHIGSGPIWPRMVRKHFEPCNKSWWGNLLLFSNKVDDVGICSETSWYLHCDFHLTILGTAIFMVYRKNKRTGLIFYSFVFVLSVILLAILNFWQELPGLLIYDVGKECFNMETNKVYNSVYTHFYTRASSYVIGIAMGYIMIVYKPRNNRRTISKSTSILGFIIGMSLLVLCLQVGGKMFEREFSVLGTAIIAAFDKTIWAIGICSIIIACEYGTLPIVNDFLGSKVFVPLSKLSYSCFISHLAFMYRDIFSLRTPAKFDFFGSIIIGLGYVVITNSVGYLIWLFIESPVTNLINLIFHFNRSSKTDKNGLKEDIYEASKTEKVL